MSDFGSAAADAVSLWVGLAGVLSLVAGLMGDNGQGKPRTPHGWVPCMSRRLLSGFQKVVLEAEGRWGR